MQDRAIVYSLQWSSPAHLQVPTKPFFVLLLFRRPGLSLSFSPFVLHFPLFSGVFFLRNEMRLTSALLQDDIASFMENEMYRKESLLGITKLTNGMEMLGQFCETLAQEHRC